MKKHLLVTFTALFFASQIAWASDIYYNITQTQSVAEIQIGLQAAIGNATNSDKVIVTGSKTNADITLTLNISVGKTVVWKADYQAILNFTPSTLIMLQGDGTFEVAGGTIMATGKTMTINSYGDNATVIVSSGTVSAASENAIIVRGLNAKVFISGGIVSNEATGDYPVIFMGNESNKELNIIIKGTGKVKASKDGCAIITSGNVEVNENAEVSSEKANAIYARGSLSTITLGGHSKVMAAGTYPAVWASSRIEVTDNAQINVMVGSALFSKNTVILSKNTQIKSLSETFGYFAVDAQGNVEVRDNAQINSIQHGAIRTTSGKVIVGGFSKIVATNYCVISADSQVEIRDNAQVITKNIDGYAIVTWGDCTTVTVSGGVVFAPVPEISNIIHHCPNFTGPTDTGILLAWNKKDNTNYEIFSEDDILKSPESVTAYWDKKGGQCGISYAYNGNTGFIPLNVTVLSVNEKNLTDTKTYPNPATGELRVETHLNVSLQDIAMFDIVGKTVGVSPYIETNTIVMDISHLTNGIYFLRVKNEVVKIVKQ